MTTWMRTLTGLTLVTLLQACEVDVKDGKLPPEYMPAAHEYEGSYTGEMDGRKGTLVLGLQDDGTVTVATPGFEGGDILGEGCGSQISPLERIVGEQSKTDQSFKLERLVFGFSRTDIWCIATNEIKFDFDHTDDGHVSILASLVLFYNSYGAPYTIYGQFVKD